MADPTTGAVVQRAAGYGGISLVQMKGSDSDWMGMNNKYGQAWEVPVTPKLPWCDTLLSYLPLFICCSDLPYIHAMTERAILLVSKRVLASCQTIVNFAGLRMTALCNVALNCFSRMVVFAHNRARV